MKTSLHSGFHSLLLSMTLLLGLAMPLAAQTLTWTNATSMNTARTYAAAVVLNDGKVLVTGGRDASNNVLSTAERYDPVAGTWTTVSMVAGRWLHRAEKLADGRVLVIAGAGAPRNPLNTAEIYDPATGTFSAVANLAESRETFASTVLSNGKVLVHGGWFGNSVRSSGEVYDPVANTWTTTGASDGRVAHSLVTLPNGKALMIAGGNNAGLGLGCYLYDPVPNTWTATGSMATGTNYSTSVVLANGKVLSVGEPAICELYDPAAGTWSNTGSMSVGRSRGNTILLGDGKVLAVGGISSFPTMPVSSEIYDPATGTWSATGSAASGRTDGVAVRLQNGVVLAAGGSVGGTALSVSVSANVAIFDAPPPTPAPTVASVSPATGLTAGGTSVTITGTNLTGATGVTIGGVAATLGTNTGTTLTVTTGARAAGAGLSVLVTTPGGTNAANTLFTYEVPYNVALGKPVIRVSSEYSLPAFSASKVTDGSTFDSFGNNYWITLDNQGVGAFFTLDLQGVFNLTEIKLRNTNNTSHNDRGTGGFRILASNSVNGSNQLISPQTILTGTLTQGSGTLASFTTSNGFTAGNYRYLHFIVDSLAPWAGGFKSAGLNEIEAFGVPGVAPPTPAPTITSASPAAGGPGASVTITGSGFTDASSVTIGGVAVTSFTVVDDTTITTTIPAGISGLVNVVVTTAAGPGTGTGVLSVVDYLITTTGNAILITDVSGHGDDLYVSNGSAGATLMFSAAGRTFSVDGAPSIADDSGLISRAGVTSITIQAGGGHDRIEFRDDTFTFGTFSDPMPSLIVNGGTGDDTVFFTGQLTFGADTSLDVDLQNDDAVPGQDRIEFADANVTSTEETLAITLRASWEISILYSSIANGSDLIAEANQQPIPHESISPAGIVVLYSNLVSDSITMKGKCLDGSGILLEGSDLISYISDITLIGNGNGGSEVSGVRLVRTTVGAFNGGGISITGQLDDGHSSYSSGVGILDGSRITSDSADIAITGTGAPQGEHSGNVGVWLADDSEVDADGSLTVNGTGGQGSPSATGDAWHGIYIQNGIMWGSSVTMTGIAGTGTLTESHGIYVDNQSGQGSSAYAYDFASLNGSSSIDDSYGVFIDAQGGNAVYGSSVTVEADTVNFTDSRSGGYALYAEGGDVIVGPSSMGRKTVIGEADSLATHLGLEQSELGLIYADSSLLIGSASSGIIEQTADTQLLSTQNVIYRSGNEIRFTNSSLTTDGGNFLAFPGPGHSFYNTGTGTDLDLSGADFSSGGKLGFRVTSGTVYDTLKVNGTVSLSGVVLNLEDASAGAYTPSAAQSFTLIDNDGTDAVNGTFTGLAEGATVSVNGVDKKLTYLGGTGNDVALVPGNAPPTITSNGGGAAATINVPENTTAVTTVVASDAEVPATQTLTYSKSGTNEGLFNIDSSTGALTFAAAPDFETNPGPFSVTVSATDNGTPILSDSQALTITVTDVSDPITTASGEHVITSAGAPDATGADSGAKFDLLKRGGFLADNGHFVFPGELIVGFGGVTTSPNTFMGLWKEGGSGLKLLARSGDAAPGTDAVFDILPSVPAINDSGEVTFLASLSLTGGTTPATTTNDIGLWSELGSTGLQLLIREDDTLPTQVPPLPAGTKVGAFASGAYATAHTSATTGEAAFAVTFKGGSTDTAVLRASVNPSTVAVSVIARQNTIAPGTTQNFASLNGSYTDSMRMDATGNLVFVALLTSPSKEGIWYQPVGGAVTKAFIAGDTAPGTSGATFKNIKSPAIGSAGVITFRGQLNTNGDNASNAKNDGIWRGTVAGGFSSILRRGDSGFAGMPGGSKVGNVWHGWLNNANHGAWRAWLNVNGNGVASSTTNGDVNAIFTDINGGVMEMAVKVGDAAPGIPGATFASMDLPVVGSASATPSANEWVAFIGKVTGGGTTAGVDDLGIWRKTGAGAFQLVIRAGDSITTTEGTKTIQKVDFPGSSSTDRRWEQPVMDNAGRLLIYVQFIDGSSSQLLTP